MNLTRPVRRLIKKKNKKKGEKLIEDLKLLNAESFLATFDSLTENEKKETYQRLIYRIRQEKLQEGIDNGTID